VSNLSAITGREGWFTPAAFGFSGSHGTLGQPIPALVKQRG
jgi:hypothetical protein